jgi:regulator of replication initiation timing
MADEQDIAQDKPDAEEVVKQELSPVEQKAMESGWVPEDEWAGDKSQWRPAKEFLDRGELFKKIDDQNRNVKELKRALDDMKRHHNSVRETEYTRALQSLKTQKQTALEEGDAATVVRIDDQIDLVRDEQTKLKQDTAKEEYTSPEPAPEFTNWVSQNKWYENDTNMKTWADGIGRNLAAAGMKPDNVLREIEKQVKEVFPNKFRNANRDKPGAVEGSSNKGGKSTGSFVLSDDERRVMQRFVRSGVMTEAQYVKDLKSVRGE